MPTSFKMCEVQTIIRRKLKLKQEQGLFLMCNEGKDLVKSNSALKDVFEKYQDEDGFLYILYTGEDVYG